MRGNREGGHARRRGVCVTRHRGTQRSLRRLLRCLQEGRLFQVGEWRQQGDSQYSAAPVLTISPHPIHPPRLARRYRVRLQGNLWLWTDRHRDSRRGHGRLCHPKEGPRELGAWCVACASTSVGLVDADFDSVSFLAPIPSHRIASHPCSALVCPMPSTMTRSPSATKRSPTGQAARPKYRNSHVQHHSDDRLRSDGPDR